jgi:hypothetical protein
MRIAYGFHEYFGIVAQNKNCRVTTVARNQQKNRVLCAVRVDGCARNTRIHIAFTKQQFHCRRRKACSTRSFA